MVLLLRVKHLFLALVCCSASLLADLDYTVTNTNFTLSQGSIVPGSDERYLYNYNRLRLQADYTYENYFVTVIGDGVNYLGHDYIEAPDFGYIKQLKSDTPFKTQTKYFVWVLKGVSDLSCLM